MIRLIVLILSIVGLIVAIFWGIHSGWEHEPIYTIILTVAGIVGSFFIPKSNKNTSLNLGSENENEQAINAKTGGSNSNFSFNLGNKNKTKQTITEENG